MSAICKQNDVLRALASFVGANFLETKRVQTALPTSAVLAKVHATLSGVSAILVTGLLAQRRGWRRIQSATRRMVGPTARRTAKRRNGIREIGIATPRNEKFVYIESE